MGWTTSHQDSNLDIYVVNLCKKKRLWEPQETQMPHTNVLDLAVFPTMYFHNRNLIRYLMGMRFAKEDETWKISAKVWEELPS